MAGRPATIMEEEVRMKMTGKETWDLAALYGDLAARADFQLLKRVVLDGRTMLEAAEEYGITVEACKKRIQRLRAHLKKKLSDL